MKHSKYKVLYLFAFCFLQSAFCNAQNLVPNPSFEEYDTCPNNTGQIRYALHWFNYGSQDPEYYNSCSTDGYSTPSNIFGYQLSYNGVAYSGLYTFCWQSPKYREYITIQLLSQLILGQKYYVNFKVNLADKNTTCGIDKIGILFSTQPYYFNSINPTFKNFSHIYTDSVILDTLNWSTISGSFIADSAYAYLSIGNFYDSLNTHCVFFDSYNKCVAYYYIDDVCVSPDSLTCNPPDAISKINISNNNVNVYPNPTFDKITIEMPEVYKNNDVIIYNLLGIEIINTFLTLDESKIDISNLSPGVYFVQINFNNKTVIKKIVKL